MATRTASVTGNASNSATFGGSTLADGDIVVVNAGVTLTFDANYTLGDKSAGIGHGLTINATDATTFGRVTINDGVSLTLRGFDRSSNCCARINRYGLFDPQPGATLLLDVASDYQSIIDNRGRFEAIGTEAKPINIWGAGGIDWSNQVTDESKTSVPFNKTLNIQVTKLANLWVANAAGTAIGALGDTSVSFNTLSDAAILQTEVATRAAVDAVGKYYIDYDGGLIYLYATASKTFKATYKRLSFFGAGINSLQDNTYNTAIFAYVDGRYLGCRSGTQGAAIRVASKKSAAVEANRLFSCTNSTFRWSGRLIEVDAVTGTALDPIAVTDNTFIHPEGSGLYGNVLYSYNGGPSSFLDFARNDINSYNSVLRAHNAVLTSWTIRNNTVINASCFIQALHPDGSVTGSTWPDTVVSDNNIEGAGNAGDTMLILGACGTSGHPFVVRNNTLARGYRAATLGQYMTLDSNILHDNYHHNIIGNNQDDTYLPGVEITNNLIIGGGCDFPILQLGYNHRMVFYRPKIWGNTLMAGGIELGDYLDNSGSITIIGGYVGNNLIVSPSTSAGITKQVDTATYRQRVGLIACEANLIYDPTTAAYVGLSHQAIFARSGVRYNTDATRNVLGVALYDSSYSSPPAAKSLVFTYTSATDQTLAWGGGTAQQLVLASGTATAGASNTLTNSGASFPTARNNSSCPQCSWLVITGGTGSGQKRVITHNTSTVLTVSPAWSTQPDATSTYTILKSEVQCYDSGATDYVRAGIDATDLPVSSQTDTGIEMTYSEPTADPLTTQTGEYDTNPLHYKFAAASPAKDAGSTLLAASVLDDYFGTVRDGTPDIGFYEYLASSGGGTGMGSRRGHTLLRP